MIDDLLLKVGVEAREVRLRVGEGRILVYAVRASRAQQNFGSVDWLVANLILQSGDHEHWKFCDDLNLVPSALDNLHHTTHSTVSIPPKMSDNGEIEVDAAAGFKVLPKDVTDEIGTIKLLYVTED